MQGSFFITCLVLRREPDGLQLKEVRDSKVESLRLIPKLNRKIMMRKAKCPACLLAAVIGCHPIYLVFFRVLAVLMND